MNALDRLAVVLVRPKYPENIGSAARACLNMGVSQLVLVDPQNLDLDKAAPLATVHAKDILTSARIEPDLPAALKDVEEVYAATARTGGWRKGALSARKAGPEIADKLRLGASVALVFGPEAAGLTNEEIHLCQRIVTIPTSVEGTSLNLAQAVLVLLYEAFANSLDHAFEPPGPPHARAATHEEKETLLATIKEALLAIDFLQKDNTDYWMMPVRRFLGRSGLKRNEFNLLMGICRQVLWASGRGRKEPQDS
ncbi:MAG: tRNA/rRNA methyltransferase [Desulfovibrionales bacterium]|jgi:tRNA/rRNA methyltransferase|nr:tRNA/rRNA methyltransferase [Desulfovibrionales bacterium]